MGSKVIEHKRLSVSETVYLVENNETKVRFWRHRYCIKERDSTRHQLFNNYDLEKFSNLSAFYAHIEKLPKPEGYIL